jgi:hypothetical protein
MKKSFFPATLVALLLVLISMPATAQRPGGVTGGNTTTSPTTTSPSDDGQVTSTQPNTRPQGTATRPRPSTNQAPNNPETNNPNYCPPRGSANNGNNQGRQSRANNGRSSQRRTTTQSRTQRTRNTGARTRPARGNNGVRLSWGTRSNTPSFNGVNSRVQSRQGAPVIRTNAANQRVLVRRGQANAKSKKQVTARRVGNGRTLRRN